MAEIVRKLFFLGGHVLLGWNHAGEPLYGRKSFTTNRRGQQVRRINIKRHLIETRANSMEISYLDLEVLNVLRQVTRTKRNKKLDLEHDDPRRGYECDILYHELYTRDEVRPFLNELFDLIDGNMPSCRVVKDERTKAFRVDRKGDKVPKYWKEIERRRQLAEAEVIKKCGQLPGNVPRPRRPRGRPRKVKNPPDDEEEVEDSTGGMDTDSEDAEDAASDVEMSGDESNSESEVRDHPESEPEDGPEDEAEDGVEHEPQDRDPHDEEDGAQHSTEVSQETESVEDGEGDAQDGLAGDGDDEFHGKDLDQHETVPEDSEGLGEVQESPYDPEAYAQGARLDLMMAQFRRKSADRKGLYNLAYEHHKAWQIEKRLEPHRRRCFRDNDKVTKVVRDGWEDIASALAERSIYSKESMRETGIDPRSERYVAIRQEIGIFLQYSGRP